MKQNTKDWIQHASAMLLIVSAVAMAFVSFWLTLDIGAGPLTYIGEALSAALALYGISMFMVNRFKDLRSELMAEIGSMRGNANPAPSRDNGRKGSRPSVADDNANKDYDDGEE